MDHLRDSVGLRGYAQVDPKVEYKREGMRTFEQMWDAVGERTTDLIFRMEQLDEGFVGSTWTGAEARHDAPPPSEIGAEQQAAIDGTQGDGKPEPIRNQEPAGRPQRSLPLRQREEVQELPHEEGGVRAKRCPFQRCTSKHRYPGAYCTSRTDAESLVRRNGRSTGGISSVKATMSITSEIVIEERRGARLSNKARHVVTHRSAFRCWRSNRLSRRL